MNIGFFAKKEQLEHASACVFSLESLHQDISVTIVCPKDAEDIFKFRFDSKKVDIISFQVPYLLHEFPFMDKIYAASLYEKTHNHFIWLDVDSFFVKPFHESIKDHGILVNPVDIKNIGISTDEELNDYWLTLLEVFEIKPNAYKSNIFKTCVTEESIYPYFNMGFIIINDNKYIFKQASDAFYKIISNEIINKYIEKSILYVIFLHQVLFTLSVMKSYFYDEIHLLPPLYNYPLHLHHQKNEKPKISELHSIRYDLFFNHPNDEITNELPTYLKANAHLLKQ